MMEKMPDWDEGGFITGIVEDWSVATLWSPTPTNTWSVPMETYETSYALFWTGMLVGGMLMTLAWLVGRWLCDED